MNIEKVRIALNSFVLIGFITVFFQAENIYLLIKNYELNIWYFSFALVGILIIEILLSVKHEDLKKPFNLSDYISGIGKSYFEFSINHIAKARFLIVMALLLFLFIFQNSYILDNNHFLSTKLLNIIAATLFIVPLSMIIVTSSDTTQGYQVTIGHPLHFIESVSLVTVPFIFMMSHKSSTMTLLCMFVITAGIFYNLNWLIRRLFNGGTAVLVQQSFFILLITYISYYFIPIVDIISKDITRTADSIFDDSGYKKDYYSIISNFETIENNLKIIKNNVPKFSKNVSQVQKDLDQCIYYSSKIKTKVKQSFYYPSTDILKNYDEVENYYNSLNVCYKNLNRSIMMLKDKNLILSTKEAIHNIDKSIYNINTSLQKIKPSKVVEKK